LIREPRTTASIGDQLIGSWRSARWRKPYAFRTCHANFCPTTLHREPLVVVRCAWEERGLAGVKLVRDLVAGHAIVEAEALRHGPALLRR